MKKPLAFLLAVFLCLAPMTSLRVNAAFIDNSHWIESNPGTVTAAYNANQSFVAMFYRTTCPNSGTRRLAVEGWMEDYDLDVYGIDVDRYPGIPDWVGQKLGFGRVTLPIICVVSNSSEYDCFSAKDSMKQIQKYLHEHLGIYDDREVDFSKLNGQILSQYSSRASTAQALYGSAASVHPMVKAQTDAIVANYTTDLERLMAIYAWIVNNIFYDYGMLEGKVPRYVSAVDTLYHERSVCEGFANLTAEMCRAAGIPCRVVTGFAAGVGTDNTIGAVWDCYEEWVTTNDLDAFRQEVSPYENHAWNEAYVDGRWIVLDTTWGCNNDAVYLGNGRYFLIPGTPTGDYFDLSIDALSQSHLTWTAFAADLEITQAGSNQAVVSGTLDEADLTAASHGLLATYTQDGKMLSCKEVLLDSTDFAQNIPWSTQAAGAKLFLLDADHRPTAAIYTARK